MTNWKVILEGVKSGQEDDLVLIFQDIRDFMDPLIIERYIFQDISDLAKKKDHYIELPNLKKVVSDKSETIPREETVLILATVKETNEKLGILLALKSEFKYEVRGLRSDNFIARVRTDSKKITEMLKKLSKNPDSFEDVNVILPEDRF